MNQAEKMSHIEKEKYFLKLLRNDKNKTQSRKLVMYMNTSQFKSLKTIALDILTEKIPLTNSEFNKLFQHKTFIRNLAWGQVSRNSLARKITVISLLVRIALNKYASHSKVSTFTSRRLGKNKRQTYERSETSDSSSSESSEISSSESANSIISKRDGENFEEKSSGEEIEMDDRVSDSWEK